MHSDAPSRAIRHLCHFCLHVPLSSPCINLHQPLRIQNAYSEPVLNPGTTAQKRWGKIMQPVVYTHKAVHALSVYKMHWQRVHIPVNIESAQDWIAEFHTWNVVETVPDFNTGFLCFCCIFVYVYLYLFVASTLINL